VVDKVRLPVELPGLDGSVRDVERLEKAFEKSATASAKLASNARKAADAERDAAKRAEETHRRRMEWEKQAAQAAAGGAAKSAVNVLGLGGPEEQLKAAVAMTSGQTAGATDEQARAQFEANLRYINRQAQEEQRVNRYAQAHRGVISAGKAVIFGLGEGGIAGGAEAFANQVFNAYVNRPGG